jgi:hypothetical protein
MKMDIVSGSTLAAAAIVLALSGATSTPVAAKSGMKSVHCMGINACKGQGACQTASSGCKGQNACKGQGWLPAKSKGACEAQGGTVG